MKAVEQLMIGEETEAQGVVHESFMQGTFHGSEGNVVTSILEDCSDAVGLFGAVATNIYGIAVGQELSERVGHQVEVLVKDGLHDGVEAHGGVGCTRRFVAELQSAEL